MIFFFFFAMESCANPSGFLILKPPAYVLGLGDRFLQWSCAWGCGWLLQAAGILQCCSDSKAHPPLLTSFLNRMSQIMSPQAFWWRKPFLLGWDKWETKRMLKGRQSLSIWLVMLGLEQEGANVFTGGQRLGLADLLTALPWKGGHRCPSWAIQGKADASPLSGG